jgi:hypothetical protein
MRGAPFAGVLALASTLAAAAPVVATAARSRGAVPIARRRWAASRAEQSCTLSKAVLTRVRLCANKPGPPVTHSIGVPAYVWQEEERLTRPKW